MTNSEIANQLRIGGPSAAAVLDIAASRLEAGGAMLKALKWAATVIQPGSDLHNDMTAAIALAEKD